MAPGQSGRGPSRNGNCQVRFGRHFDEATGRRGPCITPGGPSHGRFDEGPPNQTAGPVDGRDCPGADLVGLRTIRRRREFEHEGRRADSSVHTDDHPLFMYLGELHLSSLILAKRFDEAKEFCRGQIRRLQRDNAATKEVLAHAISDYLDIALTTNSPSDLDEVESLCRTELEKLHYVHKPAAIDEADLLETLARALVAKNSKNSESLEVEEAERCYRQSLSICWAPLLYADVRDGITDAGHCRNCW